MARPLARVLGLLGLALALLWPGEAAAARKLIDYVVHVDLRQPKTAHIELELTYEDPQLRFDDIEGFKFVGSAQSHKLEPAADQPDVVHPHFVGGYEQHRIEYTVPANPEGVSTVAFSFRQSVKIARQVRLNRRETSIPWIHEFGIPVDHAEVHLLFPRDAPEISDSRWTCAEVVAGLSCTREGNGPIPAVIRHQSDGLPLMIGFVVAAVLALAGMTWLSWQHWVRERGVLPSAAPPPGATEAWTPPPDLELEPALSPEDRKAFTVRMIGVWLLSAAGLSASVLFVGKASLELPLVVQLGLMLAVVALAAFVLGRAELSWPVKALAVLAVALAVSTLIFGFTALVVGAVLAMVFGRPLLGGGSGGGGGGWSGCGGGCSSCGGGCGGCGGGCGGCGG